MEKPFRPAPLDLLSRWIFGALDRGEPVLGLPQQNFEIPDPRLATTVHGDALAAPLGVAAGPHTQLAQNIVASWLCGARFIELKTVQILDEIHVSRPCIDAEDATYNCEWSQELTLDQSFDEYLKAWVLVHALAHKQGLPGPGALFNMSVGYDLKGIQSEKVQRFIRRMRDASAELPAAIDAVASVYPEVREADIPRQLSSHITLSTMHGCPPAEIERIARYLLLELGVHTWVKLNPTLLGPARLRGILNQTLGFDIEVPDAAFEHDPRFDDALKMVQSLRDAAKGNSATFGVKLSNTLEVVNRRRVFPPNEKMMYLSGRALHPLTLTLANLLGEALGGSVPLSFCGGADALNFADLVADGLSPITVCTDLLKPGGYARLQQYLVNLEAAMARAGADSIDEFASEGRQRLAEHSRRVAGEERYARRERPIAVKGSRALGWFDCIAAPCQEACPAHQNIPDYLWHVAQGQPDQAMDVILRTNAMPSVTGAVCDRPCTERCVRNFYDSPVAIREVKRFATLNSPPRSASRTKAPAGLEASGPGGRVAVVGAGPGGISAASFLAQAGVPVTLFEARRELGGMVSAVIPAYRLGDASIDADLARLRAQGVEVRTGTRVGKDVSIGALRAEGFESFVFMAGAQRGKKLGIPGEQSEGVFDALVLLERARKNPELPLGRRVLVVGGGNSAMDAARTARRLVTDGSVEIVYRRTRAQMPADAQEVRECVEEGVAIRDLLAPLRVEAESGRAVALVCQRMKLGEPDASGRPRPVPVPGEEVRLPCDTIIVAISQEPVLDFLDGVELARNKDGSLKVEPATFETSERGVFAGGDLTRGPASIIQAVADGRTIAAEIARRRGATLDGEVALEKRARPDALLEKRSRLRPPRTVPVLPVEERKGFTEVERPFTAEEAACEASRCLDCDELCSLCVTVCPNRANQAYATAPLKLSLPELVARGGKLAPQANGTFEVAQRVQIINVADFCNECGDCTTFCPTAGRPYRDKPKFWLDREGFETAAGDALRLERHGERVRLEARLGGVRHELTVDGARAEYRTANVAARLHAGDWRLLEVEPIGTIGEGERVSLEPCAKLIALLGAAKVLPE